MMMSDVLPGSTRVRGALRLLGAVLLGAGVAMGQAPWGLWFVALPALGLLIRACARHRAGWTGFAGGFGYALAAMFWIVEPFLVEPEIYGWMAPFALVFMAAGMGVFWGLGTRLGALLGGDTVAGVALGLAASDALRSYVFTGFPWVLLGHIWIDTPVGQAAAFIGPIGLSILTLGLVTLPWLWRWGGAGSLVVLALVWGAGVSRLHAPDPAPRMPAVNVRLVQPDAAQALKWHPDHWREFFYRHLDLTAQAPADGGPRPDLVIWPETAVPFMLNDPGAGLEMTAEAAQGAPVILGIQRSDGTRFYNSLVYVGPDGQPGLLYDKVHLVPFGEYIPFGDVMSRFGVSAFAAQQGNGYTAGAAEQVWDLGPLGRAMPLICYEAVFPQDIARAPSRPDWLLQATNDAWFGKVSGPWQHLAQARLRAIEFGLPLARAANTGISAMIDAKGRVVAELGMNKQGVIDAPLPPALPATIYARTGDLPAVVVIAVLGGVILAFGRKSRVDRRGAQA